MKEGHWSRQLIDVVWRWAVALSLGLELGVADGQGEAKRCIWEG